MLPHTLLLHVLINRTCLNCVTSSDTLNMTTEYVEYKEEVEVVLYTRAVISR